MKFAWDELARGSFTTARLSSYGGGPLTSPLAITMTPVQHERPGRPAPLVLTVSLPEYRIDARPDYSLGKRVDEVVRLNLDVGRILIRAISSSDHPRLSLDQLADVIADRGTDKYDPDREGVSPKEFESYGAELQAAPFELDERDDSVFGGVMRNFYENAPLDRGHPLRIDLILVYDRDQLSLARRAEEGEGGTDPRLERFLFRFKDPERKRDALLGVVKIL